MRVEVCDGCATCACSLMCVIKVLESDRVHRLSVVVLRL